MSDTMYVIPSIVSELSIQGYMLGGFGTQEIKLSALGEGIVGMLPVFDNYEDAVKYANDNAVSVSSIMPVIKKKGADSPPGSWALQADVREKLKQDLREGALQKDMVKKYGVSKSTVYRISKEVTSDAKARNE